ncbi:hypothetical protein GYA93_18130 [Gordonia desulfuricans]|uniref:GNAT family N-acetyltransferase n=1 Tax=Gordonia desulfuricans TaxID=89051 RepID=A0A7K3LTA5_9ACTN|nr:MULTISPECIES: hypothetical protein [Gordonia]EMP12700.1 hypothetical protein ISGA_622 [Gordonia sp. NB41Y]NDK91480.1 hypothetical protein [Gordonia desulfuricans]WLP91500.1 hypothetical protein Q9K23_04375 [Gordonia sp. NB41Y]
MEPIEINAGTWYLRALRADERITDVPALSALGIDQPATYVAAAEHDWHTETRFTWAVCIPTTGELVAVIGVDADRGLWGRCRDGHDEALTTAIGPVTRFADGALGLGAVGPLTDGL